MEERRFERLTQKQCDCLRLIGEGHSGKRAAQLLGISPYAVKERLRAARKTLDIDDSWVAARQYLEWEAHNASDERVGSISEAYPCGVEGAETLALEGIRPSSPGRGDVHGQAAVVEVKEGRAAYLIDLDRDRSSIWTALFPPAGRRPNDLSMSNRIALIAAEVAILAICISALIGAIVAASMYLNRLNQHGG